MTETPPQRKDTDPTVRALLTAFHQDTRHKLELAPVDTRPLCQRADGSECEVGEDGWPTEYDNPGVGE
ncbi:hypothetical protein ACQP2U_35825 [Nocardia sp. CA-084685]|uniref:hypothetical protein n=1 Tax=Nocardia sp. CA-084685 TaxID=3239970 RepID=UPI003D96AB41